MEHVQSSAPTDARSAKELEAAKERVGDGKQLRPEHFTHLSYAERVALHAVNPERYAALRDGIDPDAAWTPKGANL